MTPIKQLITEHGSQAKLAKALGVAPNQISRWLAGGALVEIEGGKAKVWLCTWQQKSDNLPPTFHQKLVYSLET